jgi:hypothetical protein
MILSQYNIGSVYFFFTNPVHLYLSNNTHCLCLPHDFIRSIHPPFYYPLKTHTCLHPHVSLHPQHDGLLARRPADTACHIFLSSAGRNLEHVVLFPQNYRLLWSLYPYMLTELWSELLGIK